MKFEGNIEIRTMIQFEYDIKNKDIGHILTVLIEIVQIFHIISTKAA